VPETPEMEDLRKGTLTDGTLNQPHLTDGIGLRQPTDLSLADDVHCFVPREGTQRTLD